MTEQLQLDLSNEPPQAHNADLSSFPALSYISLPRFQIKGFKDVLRVHYEGDKVRMLHGGDYCFLEEKDD